MTEELVFEGFLHNSASDYLVIVDDDGKSIALDDTLMRSKFLGMKVRITLEAMDD